MAYQVYKFDDVWLPVGNNDVEMGPGQADSGLVDSAGGVFTLWPDYQRYPRRSPVDVSGSYVGATMFETDEAGNYIVDEAGNRIVGHSAAVDLRVKLQALQSKIGAWGTLWRRTLPGQDVEQWKTAKLLRARWQQRHTDGGALAEVSCLFETRMPGWHAEDQTTDTATFTASGLQQLNVDNGGELRVDDAEIVITSGSGGYTSVRVQCADTGVDWTFTGGTAATGATRTIDCDTGTIRSGSDVDMYEYFTLNSGHTARGWLPLEVGNNQLIVIQQNTAMLEEKSCCFRKKHVCDLINHIACRL